MLGERHLTHSSGAQFYSIPWQKLPKAPKQKPPEPGSSRSLPPQRCVLLAAEGAYLPCASIMTFLSQKHPLLVWLDPQAYLLGETVRFKEHTIAMRIFFNGLWWSGEANLTVPSLVCELPWLTQQHSSVTTYHQLRNESFASSWHYRMRTEIQFKHFENLPVLSIMRVKLLLKVSLFHGILF